LQDGTLGGFSLPAQFRYEALKGHAMSKLIARINNLQRFVRQALHDEISPEQRADIAEIAEAMRQVLREQDLLRVDDHVGRATRRRSSDARPALTRQNRLASGR
jgi:hypothetical protein